MDQNDLLTCGSSGGKYPYYPQKPAEVFLTGDDVPPSVKIPIMLHPRVKRLSGARCRSRCCTWIPAGNSRYYEFVTVPPAYGCRLRVHKNPEGVAMGINPFARQRQTTDIMKTEGLKRALNKYGFDAAFGGARRDEEKSRAKERIYSFRDRFHRWDPKTSVRMWHNYNGQINKGRKHSRLPLSNWTELDIWQYILSSGKY